MLSRLISKKVPALLLLALSLALPASRSFDETDSYPRTTPRPVTDTTVTITINGKDTVRSVSVEASHSKVLEWQHEEETVVALRRIAKTQEKILFVHQVTLGIQVGLLAIAVLVSLAAAGT